MGHIAGLVEGRVFDKKGRGSEEVGRGRERGTVDKKREERGRGQLAGDTCGMERGRKREKYLHFNSR